MSLETARQLAGESVGERVADGFGRTASQVGIIIAMASIIGVCMLESGSADRLVRWVLRLLGEKRAPSAFLGSGFLLAIPVFFDTVFYLMIPLAKAMRLRTGKNYLLYILAVVAGGTMAHSLVPPTPGPLFVAAEFGVDMGVMILGGCVVGMVASSVGFAFAYWAGRRWDFPLRESEESLAQLNELSKRDESGLPATWLSFLPILLPVVLIAGRTVLEAGVWGTPADLPWGSLILVLGDKQIALTLAAVIALLTLLKATSGGKTGEAVKSALRTAGVIILIIGAGGAFGSALQQTGIGLAIKDLATTYQLSILPLAFFLTALIRTAQGSATVAMITAAGAFSGIADPAILGFHPLYLALAIGCGSKPVWWMNDSGFWVVSQMSGMTEAEGLRTLTPLLVFMGLAGLVATLILAFIFPLI
jgi:GntP family gluconate:H+ symporter